MSAAPFYQMPVAANNYNFNRPQAEILKKLCSTFLSDKKENLDAVFKKAREALITYEDDEFHASFTAWEEILVTERVEAILKKKYSNADYVIGNFQALCRSLRTADPQDCFPQQLLFLLKMTEQNERLCFERPRIDESEINGNISISELTCNNTADSTTFTSSHWITNSSTPPKEREGNGVNAEVFESPIRRKFGPTNHLFTDTPILEPTATSSRKGSSNKSNGSIRQHVDNVSSSEVEVRNEPVRPKRLSVSKRGDIKKNNILSNFEVTENEIIKELIFCMQGIEGNIIKYKSVEEGFYLNPTVNVNQPYMVLHLIELGYLHNKIKQYASALFADAGTVAQGLLNAVRRELTEYYKALAALDAQLNQTPEIADTPLSEEECTKYRLPSLSQLLVWSRDPFLKLQTLYDVLEAIQDKRGGQIISDLADLSYHGNPKVKKIILRLLSSAIQPFYKQIVYWVVNGEIIDSHNEFFVSMVDNVECRDAWDKQFVLRSSMIPRYMSVEEANQILETGRCMHFLHNVCHQRPQFTVSQIAMLDLEKNDWNDPVSLIEPANTVSELINKAYREVSKNVLHLLNVNFKMLTHLEALRKYMLLGQGDFIHYLLEVIEPDLNKCVRALHTYTLMRSLEDAVYKSNARFDDPDVLSKLCIKMLVSSEEENASEAFCLQYRLDGPLNMIFKQSCVGYNRLFTFMWRVKRTNYMVLKMWRGLKLLYKEVNKFIPEARPIFMKANCLVMEMVNFIGHFQYYIASEVVEESWRKFQNELKKMESLEKVLQAHNIFLESMQFGCMLNTKPGSSHATMAWHIRTLLDYAQELMPTVEMFQTVCESEVERRKVRQEAAAEFGFSHRSEQENNSETAIFMEEMTNVKTKFKTLANEYEKKLKSLLTLFSGNYEQQELNLLSHRIDFNEYYKRKDNRSIDQFRLCKKQFPK